MRWHAAHAGAWASAGLVAALTWLLSATRSGTDAWRDDLTVLLWAAGTAAAALILTLPVHVALRRDIGRPAYLRSLLATTIIAVVLVGAAAGLSFLVGHLALVAGAALAAALAGSLSLWWMAGRRPGRHAALSALAVLDAAALAAAAWLLLPLAESALWVAFTAAAGSAFALNGAAVALWAQPFQRPRRLGGP